MNNAWGTEVDGGMGCAVIVDERTTVRVREVATVVPGAIMGVSVETLLASMTLDMVLEMAAMAGRTA